MAKNGRRNGKNDNSAMRPIRTAVLRGLGVLIPPLMTIVIFLWVGNTIQDYVLTPVTNGLREMIVWQDPVDSYVREEEDLTLLPESGGRVGTDKDDDDGVQYRRLESEEFIKKEIVDEVRDNAGDEPIPETAKGVYRRYIELRYLNPYRVVPCFLALFTLILYLLGKFMAARIGRTFWTVFERGILQLPVVRQVYSSVKQVSDFMFSESEIEYTRVVAVQYPRQGIWSLGFVTGESLQDIAKVAGEPVLSVLMCTSPMPMTGFTITVRKSEVIDLDVTIDEAFQFIVSCGVVVPPHQLAGAHQLEGASAAIESEAPAADSP